MLDAMPNLEIKWNNERIPFVTKFTLLGVILDQYLTFDSHTIALCSKVNWKISILKRSSYLFNLNFRVILFKLFILSKYDYCSSLYFFFTGNKNHERLDNNYEKSLKSYLNIKIRKLNIKQQYVLLMNSKLFPLKLRFFQNIVFFFFFRERQKR